MPEKKLGGGGLTGQFIAVWSWQECGRGVQFQDAFRLQDSLKGLKSHEKAAYGKSLSHADASSRREPRGAGGGGWLLLCVPGPPHTLGGRDVPDTVLLRTDTGGRAGAALPGNPE